MADHGAVNPSRDHVHNNSHNTHYQTSSLASRQAHNTHYHTSSLASRQAHIVDAVANKTRGSSAAQQLVVDIGHAVEDIVLGYSDFQDDNGGVSESFQVLAI